MSAAHGQCPHCKEALGVSHSTHTDESAAQHLADVIADHIAKSRPCATIANLRAELAAVTKERDEQSALARDDQGELWADECERARANLAAAAHVAAILRHSADEDAVTIGRLIDERNALEGRNARLVGLLRKHQWAGVDVGVDGMAGAAVCPECEDTAANHAPYCALAAALKEST